MDIDMRFFENGFVEEQNEVPIELHDFTADVDGGNGSEKVDVIFVNHAAVKNETADIRHNQNNNTLVDIPISVTVWEGDMEIVSSRNKNKEESQRLMGTSSKNGSDVELSDFRSDTDNEDSGNVKKKLLDGEKCDDAELQSLSSLEDDTPGFDASRLIITNDVSFMGGSSKQAPTEDLNVVSNSHSIQAQQKQIGKEEHVENVNVCSKEDICYLSTNENIHTDVSQDISTTDQSTLHHTGGETLDPARSRSVSSTSEHHEAIELLPRHTEAEIVNEEGHVTSAMDDDNISDTSEFRGSLGIDVVAGTWLSDINVHLDLQLGRDEWESALNEVEGESSLEDWETTILDIGDSKATEEDWKTSLSNISNLDHKEDREGWKSKIPETLVNNEKAHDWSTKIKEIEKIDQSGNRWSTMFNKIKENITNKKEWKTKFNSIGKNTINKNEWKFKLPDQFTSHASKIDWQTKINKTGDVTSANDQWKYKSSEMLVTSDDRVTHWNTAFKDIEKHVADINEWKTRLKQISPLFEEGTWSFHFADCSDDIGSPEDWNMKFIDIAKNENEELNWSIKMNDVPDSYREVEDWVTSFKDIEEVNQEMNRWNTKFNDIIPNGDESALWTNTFLTADTTDMSRETWETSFNDILPNENTELDWEVTVRPIEPLQS